MHKNLLAMLIPTIFTQFFVTKMAEDSGSQLSEEQLQAFGNFDEWDITDLEELPSFDPWPNGAHVATVEFNKTVFKNSEGVDVPALSMELTYASTEQLEDTSAEVKLPNAGDTYSFLYQIQNEFGQVALRKVLEPLAEATGVTKTAALMEHVRGFTVLVVTKQRLDKKNDVMRMNVADIQVAG